jgi:curved DNA-binding protein
MPPSRDYYRILGVREDAAAEDLKKAYRRLAREHHPDRNPDKPGAEDRFKEIQEAYDVLGDVEKRRRYDRLRRNPFMSNGFKTTAGNRYERAQDGTYVRREETEPSSSGFGDLFGVDLGLGGISDFFSRIFGAGSEEAPRARGRSVAVTLRLPFEQALAGGKTELRLPDGETVRLVIPKGVDSGFKIRLKGRSDEAGQERRAEFVVTFEVEPHPRFRRERNDLHTTMPVNAIEAVLGVERSISNAYGRQVRVPVPKGTQPGERLRLRGQGVETAQGVGDLYVEVEVTVPRNLDADQLETLRAAAKRARIL